MTAEDIAHSFYTAFSNRDADKMASLYHDDIVFSDSAFGTLHGDRAKAMWKMLMSNEESGLSITYEVKEHTTDTATVHWRADYLFGPSKRKVVNHVHADLVVREGLIIRHADSFDFWKWSRQAMGFTGTALGWTPFMKGAVKKKVNSMLDRYMQKNPG